MRTSLIAAAGTVILACATASTASAQLVTNGGFETGSFSGWTTFGNFEFTGVTSDPPVHSGTFAAFFGPVELPDGISQTIATTIGHTYTFSYWLFTDGDTPNSFEATWDGVPVQSFIDASAIDPFALESFTVTATHPLTDISFTFQDDPSYWYLDDVSVTDGASVTPEPATMSLVAIGLVGMIGSGMRRRKRVL